MAVTMLGYANLRVTDLARALNHYCDLLGLRLIERDSRGRAYLQAVEAQDHHCLVLTPADRAGLDHAGWKVDDPEDLDRVHLALTGRGIATRREHDLLGQGEGLRFTAPSGHDFLFYHHADKCGYATGMRNPDPVWCAPQAAPGHLDHMVVSCADPAELAALFREAFGFYVTEQLVIPTGAPAAIFLSCSNTMHDLAIILGPHGGFHHVAFCCENRSDVIAAADRLRRVDTTLLDYGISRHGIAGVTTVYAKDPAGNWNEVCNGAYPAAGVGGRVPVISWDAAGMDRALFYYEGDAPESFGVTT